jgi:hypothetical protein
MSLKAIRHYAEAIYVEEFRGSTPNRLMLCVFTVDKPNLFGDGATPTTEIFSRDNLFLHGDFQET